MDRDVAARSILIEVVGRDSFETRSHSILLEREGSQAAVVLPVRA
jgi:hypothetical protein